MTDARPLILGLPGTGNNLIAGLVGGAIHHYSNGLGRVDLSVPIIIPIRDRHLHWYRSTKRTDWGDERPAGKIMDPLKFSSQAEMHHSHWWPTLRDIAGENRPLIVRYEDIVADPDKWREILCAHAGVDLATHDWARRVTDENAKWRKQMEQLEGREPGRRVKG